MVDLDPSPLRQSCVGIMVWETAKNCCQRNVITSLFQVTRDGIAAQAGLKAGDGILQIGDMETPRFTHEQARGEIIRSGNEVRLTVQR